MGVGVGVRVGVGVGVGAEVQTAEETTSEVCAVVRSPHTSHPTPHISPLTQAYVAEREGRKEVSTDRRAHARAAAGGGGDDDDLVGSPSEAMLPSMVDEVYACSAPYAHAPHMHVHARMWANS